MARGGAQAVFHNLQDMEGVGEVEQMTTRLRKATRSASQVLDKLARSECHSMYEFHYGP